MKQKTCIVIDDEINVRKRLEDLLGKFKDIQILASEGNPEKGIELIEALKPDIVFIDVEMPRMSGFDVVKTIRKKKLNPCFIFVTAYNQYAIKAIKNEAFDYLLKPVDIDELAESIKRYSLKGTNFLNNQEIAPLSLREIEILEMLKNEMTSKEIAEKLHISKTTVDTHRRNILEKTGAKSTKDLIEKNIN